MEALSAVQVPALSYINKGKPQKICNACTENEVCQKRGGVYGCGCLQRQRPNPEIFDAVESCASSTGSMSLSRCQLFESGFYPENLHLNDPRCRGTLEDGRLVFHFDNEAHICGTTLMSNKTHFIYQNSIQCTPRNTDQSVITRERWMNITFSCVYPLIQTLSMTMGIQAEGGVVSKELPAGQGTYQIRMIPYHDAQFTSPFDGEVQLQVNQQMYVAVEVEGVDRNQIATVLDNCWATPVNDIDYHLRWNLIIRECPNPEDGTVEVLQNGIDTKSHFSFRMFTFTAISDHIFLHCQVHLCLVQSGRCALHLPDADGTERSSDRTLLDKSLFDYFAGTVVSVDIDVKEILGDLVLVKLETDKILLNYQWYCRCINVTTPFGDSVEFPCYRWISNEKEVFLRDGKDRLPQDDNYKEYRRKELESRQLQFRFDTTDTIICKYSTNM
ncbi:hypothetical protein QQF64_035871 [Cirrhinus molitorella]|uniref:ZP domain-containing protein n=1 Tax=Cirrhinus molitorella TaxID=172907 RepID=A0ABR3NHS3_9TELE